MSGLIYEDEHLLVVNKPAGVNTHAPAPYAGEGIYEWLKNREPRWADLAIIHRLDKETSGVLVFGKTPAANRSLTKQFTERQVKKSYLFVTDGKPPDRELVVHSQMVRVGDKYAVSQLKGQIAETIFRPVPGEIASLLTSDLSKLDQKRSRLAMVEAEPLTGRTHQIRVHAADQGLPVLGDTLYGGTRAPRVYLHSARIELAHPDSGKLMLFEAPPEFEVPPFLALRSMFADENETTCWRVIHGSSDGWPGVYVDKAGPYLLAQGEDAPSPKRLEILQNLSGKLGVKGVYEKALTRQVRQKSIPESSPKLCSGEAAPNRFSVLENALKFELSFTEGYSVGLFFDQRDNRRRLRTGHVGAKFDLQSSGDSGKLQVLNTFAYTCAFSVCAAKAGARVTSLDLSRKYLEWGKRNFALNQLDPEDHDFIYGDVVDWLRRFKKRERLFDVIVLDPPTFSASKEHGVFRAQKDYGKLVVASLPVLKKGGVLFASSNAADWSPDDFVETVHEAVRSQSRVIEREQYYPQPPDFPISRAEPGYLKTVWMKIE